jgi:cyclophilin family peptidyl-prolyl cis-trans isomerase
VELFEEAAPKAAENFRCLCTGEKGRGKAGRPLTLRGCPVHRMLKGFCLQTGWHPAEQADGSARGPLTLGGAQATLSKATAVPAIPSTVREGVGRVHVGAGGWAGLALTGGRTSQGGKFNDDKGGLKLSHDARGLLAMANSGKNSNTSQFFITFAPQPKLDGKHVVFGRVVAGLDVLDTLEAAASDEDGPPKHRVVISDCGAVA